MCPDKPGILLAAALCCAFIFLSAGQSFAVSARPVVAPPSSPQTTPSRIYGQNGQNLPADGISVREKKTTDEQFRDELDDYDNAQVSAIADPIEPWNRFWFGFNDIFYIYIANPAYRFWETVTPRQLRTAISNVWHNLLFPLRFVNNLLQFRFKAAGVEFGRFIINSTAGMGDS